MLFFTPPGVSSSLLPQGKELVFNLQPLRSPAREHHLGFRAFSKESFSGGRGGRFFFSPVYQFSLSWLNLECVVAQLLRWSLPLRQSMGPAAQHTAEPHLSIFVSSFPVS